MTVPGRHSGRAPELCWEADYAEITGIGVNRPGAMVASNVVTVLQAHPS